jgi:hypothetical protein
MDSDGAFLCVVLAMLAFMLGLSVGHAGGVNSASRDAVKAGAATYVVDSETGEAKFQYKVLPVAP